MRCRLRIGSQPDTDSPLREETPCPPSQTRPAKPPRPTLPPSARSRRLPRGRLHLRRRLPAPPRRCPPCRPTICRLRKDHRGVLRVHREADREPEGLHRALLRRRHPLGVLIGSARLAREFGPPGGSVSRPHRDPTPRRQIGIRKESDDRRASRRQRCRFGPADPDAVTDLSATAPSCGRPTSTVSDIDRIAARRTVDAAKQLLMTRQGMTEPEAHRWIQKTAMDRRTTKVLVAGSIIAGFAEPVDAQ